MMISSEYAALTVLLGALLGVLIGYAIAADRERAYEASVCTNNVDSFSREAFACRAQLEACQSANGPRPAPARPYEVQP